MIHCLSPCNSSFSHDLPAPPVLCKMQQVRCWATTLVNNRAVHKWKVSIPKRKRAKHAQIKWRRAFASTSFTTLHVTPAVYRNIFSCLVPHRISTFRYCNNHTQWDDSRRCSVGCSRCVPLSQGLGFEMLMSQFTFVDEWDFAANDGPGGHGRR